jgi:energy-coupling factor transporter ATP-binding protein EcfA2
MPTLKLPKPMSTKDSVEYKAVSSMAIVGANGSGKSRLGVWIESNQAAGVFVHRISAQRALVIQDYIQPRPLDQANRLLTIGSDHPSHNASQKFNHRWQQNPTGHLLNDFDIVLAWMFAQHFKTADDFREECKASNGQLPSITESKLEAALRIWHEAMPQRRLVARDNKVVAHIAGAGEYAGKETSDGERVALYLIAQCLAAPPDSIIVLDEPELHLHQAIQAQLWDAIEAARPDCVIVYITHDLGFAASRTTATKIWVKDYPGKNSWDWQEIQATDQFPESMILRILGSRRQILFVEGDVSSVDIAIYRALYPGRLVIPRSSCSSVIESPKALASLPQLHHTEVYGIIDRDHRSDIEINSYAKDRVFAPLVAEIENLFLAPEALTFVSTHLKRDSSADLTTVQTYLFSELQRELPVQVNDRAVFQIQQRLNNFPGVRDRGGSSADFKKAVDDYLGPIDATQIHKESEALFNDIVGRRDYHALLKHYNRKSLAARISRNLGLGEGEYPKLVIRLLHSKEGEPLRQTLQKLVPAIP